MALFEIKHRTRNRLETVHNSHNKALIPIFIGVLMLLMSFVISNETVFRCEKLHGEPSLNDICYKDTTTLLASLPVVSRILPSSFYHSRVVFPLRYIAKASVQEIPHYNQETHLTTYSYRTVLFMNSALQQQPDEVKAQDEFFTSNNVENHHRIARHEINQSEFYDDLHEYNSVEEPERTAKRLNILFNQYHQIPTQPVFFNESTNEFFPEMLLIAALGLFYLGFAHMEVSEHITLDYDTKLLTYTTKSLLGSIRRSEIIEINRIQKFDVIRRVASRTVFRRGSFGETHETDVPAISYVAELEYTDFHNNAHTTAMNNHRTRAVRTYRDPAAETQPASQPLTAEEIAPAPLDIASTPEEVASAPEMDENVETTEGVTPSNLAGEQQTSENPTAPILPPNDNYSSSEMREDLNQPRAPIPSAAPTTTHVTSPSTSTKRITLLCGNHYSQESQSKVREYVQLFTDWIADFKFRQQLQIREHDNLLQAMATTAASNPVSEQQVASILRRRNAARYANDHEVIDDTPEIHDDGNLSDTGISTGPVEIVETEVNRNRVCCICLDGDQPVRTVLMPCRHMNLCDACACAVDKCPTCRAAIDYTLPVYL